MTGDDASEAPSQAESDGPSPSSSDVPPLRCCCGDLNCIVLRHNCSILESVEKDVHMAAKLGQVCCPLPSILELMVVSFRFVSLLSRLLLLFYFLALFSPVNRNSIRLDRVPRAVLFST